MNLRKVKRVLSMVSIFMILCSGYALILRYFFNSKNVISTNYSSYTVVIDAGHGGMDGGAVGTTYNSKEKDINLQVADKVYYLMNLYGIACTRTRTDDISLNYNPENSVARNKAVDLATRLDMTNSFPSPVFLSIHMNKFEQSKYSGAQVFYSVNNESGAILANYIQNSLIGRVDNSNKRVAKPSSDGSVFLLKNLKCPAVLVECGFLSNPEEELKLNNKQYQQKLANAILAGYIEFLYS